jgi:hypothetical protein
MALVIQSRDQLRSLPYGCPFLINSVIEVLRVLSDAGVSNKFISEKRSSRDRSPRKSCSIHVSKNTPNRDRQSFRNWRDNGPQYPNPEGGSGTEEANSGAKLKPLIKTP